MHSVSYCMKARKEMLFFFFFNKCQLPCEIRLNSNINGLFGQVLSILQWRYISTEDQNHEPCWQPAASAARNKTRNKCFMKQTYTSIPYFLVTSLLPAAESNHHSVFFVCFLVVVFALFPLQLQHILESRTVILKLRPPLISNPQRDFRFRPLLLTLASKEGKINSVNPE